ncbi:S8 family serine peptidase [Jatrophihabitans sp. YIM 134969]
MTQGFSPLTSALRQRGTARAADNQEEQSDLTQIHPIAAIHPGGTLHVSTRRTRLGIGVTAACALAAGAVVAGATAPATAAPSTPGATESVIVVLADQLHATPPTASKVGARRSSATAAQNAVLARLAGAKPTHVVHYTTANAFSATVSVAQAASLAADPAVASVVQNQKIEVSAPTAPGSTTTTPATPGTLPHAQPKATPNEQGVPSSDAVCPTDPSKPLLEPEALEDTHTASDDPSQPTAQQLVDGSGVKVAYIADGIDPDNPDFIRADGSHVITDYKAFSADGPAPEEGGAEAYGDASSIAAQGLVSHDLSTFVNPAYPLPAGCNIRILGMSPGASIVALKIDFYTTSIVQAIDYAVSVDHVDVINESFGGNPVPDAATRSAISAFNDMAVAAGTTVTASSGDAGTTSTIGNPATDPQVITVAASTNSRAYLQTGYAGARTFGNGRWINDEISSLSSGGYTQSGGTVDLAAPGESGWSACDARAPECANYRGGTSDIQLFGGTSQSAPLTAGAAALVIDAYRSTHDGASPAPELVKQLLTSTARDLGLPAFEQGAGLLDSRAAVEAALTYPGATGTAPAGVKSNIVLSTSQIDVAGTPGSSKSTPVTVTNAGTKPLTVALAGRTEATTQVATVKTDIDAASTKTFPYPTTGAPWVYKKVTFSVPASTDRLALAMTWQGAAKIVNGARVTPVVRVSLFNPDGTYVANSRPQGGAVSANYANLDVRQPAAGTWTAVIYTVAGANGYTGPVAIRTTAQQSIPAGRVSSPTLTLAPGASKKVSVVLTVPADSGDTSQSIVVTSSDGHQTSIAAVIRSLVAVQGGTGTFHGSITGGNARAGSSAQVFTYGVDVPAGRKDLSVGVELATNPGDLLEGVLVDPHDETQAIDTNLRLDTAGNPTGQGRTMQLTTAAPVAGRWRVVVLVVNPVTGTEFQQPFTGTVRFDQNKVVATGVPTSASTTLARGKAVQAKVKVTNTGIAPINVQVDPRTGQLQQLPLTSPFGPQSFQLPNHAGPTFLVPPGTSSLTAVGTSTLPALAELQAGAGGIDVVGDLEAAQGGSTVSVAKVAEQTGTVSTGLWFTDLNEIGAVDENGAPTASARVDLSAKTRPLDPAVTSSTGDFFAASFDPTADTGQAVQIAPGASATITVSITPTAKVGAVVKGVLNVYTPPAFLSAFYTTGDVLATVPYSYTVGAPSVS